MVRGDSQLGSPRSRAKQWAKRLAYPWVLRQFDACLYVGQRNREYLRFYGVPAGKLYFSPHCIDNDGFAARARAADPLQIRADVMNALPQERVLLFCGKLLPGKRPLDLVEAAAILRGRGHAVRPVFAGDGPLRAAVQARAAALQVPTTFLGFRNQSELPALYAAADVVALTSAFETWGLVINEALACGTPVAAADAAGCVPDLVTPDTGAAYETGNVPALADALERVLQAPPPAGSIGSVIERYSVGAAADGVIEAADALASPKEVTA
jgi:glycosyltransferase involved in cell wall biosynthesis